jgi:hypothetical protein
MQITEVSVVGVRSAVVALKRRNTPLRFLLFPMLHIARPDFYQEVSERLRDVDLIVAEGSDAPSSVGRAYQIALRRTRQRGASPLVHQDLDYGMLGIPVIWPDNLGPQDRHRRRLSFLGWLDLIIMVPVLTVTMAVGGRKWLLRRNLELSSDSEVRLGPSFLHRRMVDDRDDALLAALEEIHKTRAEQPIDVAVVYGAAHMPTVIRGLGARFKYKPQRGGDWLTVIDF